MPLTDTKCRTCKPAEKPYKLAAGSGLYLYVSSKGSKSWRYNYKLAEKHFTYTYGKFPAMSLKEARAAHEKAHKLVSHGLDPRQVKKKQDQILLRQAQSNTFTAIAYEWLGKREAEVKEKTYRDIKKRLQQDVIPVVGKFAINGLSPPIILEMLRRIEARGAYEMASRARQYCGQIFRYAIATGRAERDYAADLKDALISPKTTHQPALEPDEIAEFLEALSKNEARLFRPTHFALEMLMHTFVRPIELVSAEWAHFNFDTKRWLIPETKMGKVHVVPLSKRVLEILDEMKAYSEGRVHVFPSQRSPRNHMNRDTLSKAVRLMGFQGRHTAHGFRALAATSLLERLGYPFEVVDAQLSHAKKGALGEAYDRAKYLDQRTEMMEAWSQYLEDLMGNDVKQLNVEERG